MQSMDRTIPLTLPWDETFDVGSDTGTSVDDSDYQVPSAFTGTSGKLTVSLVPPTPLTEDEKGRLEAAYRAAQDAH